MRVRVFLLLASTAVLYLTPGNLDMSIRIPLGVGTYPVRMVVLFVLLVSTLMLIGLRKRLILWGGEPLILLLAMAYLSGLFRYSFAEDTIKALSFIFLPMLIPTALLNAKLTDEEIRTTVLFVLLMGFLLSVQAFVSILGLPLPGWLPLSTGEWLVLRAQSTVGNPVNTSVVLATLTSLALVKHLYDRSWYTLGLTMVLISGLILTFSMTGLLMLLSIAVIPIALAQNALQGMRLRVSWIVATLVAIAIGLALAPDWAVTDRIAAPISSDISQQTARSRFELMGAGLAVARSSPLFGIGLYYRRPPLMSRPVDWRPVSPEAVGYPHNMWILALAETGFIGVLILASLLLVSLRAMLRRRGQLTAKAMSIVVLQLAVYSVFSGAVLYQHTIAMHFWLLVGLGLCRTSSPMQHRVR